MRIVTDALYYGIRSHTISGATTVGDISQTAPPFGTTDTSATGTWQEVYVEPLVTETVDDARSYFQQKGSLYRNENGVVHAKSTARVIPYSTMVPVSGADLILPSRAVTSTATYYSANVVRVAELPGWIQMGPYEAGICHIVAYWSVECKGLLRDTTYSVSAWGAIFNTQTHQWRDVILTTSYPKDSNPRCIADLISLLDNTTLYASSISERWYSTRSRRYSLTKEQKDRAIRQVQSKQRVVMAQLQNSIGISSWAAESRTLTDARYSARGHIVTSIADQVGRLTNNNAALVLELTRLASKVVALFRGDPSDLKTLFRDIRNVKNAKDAARVAANVRLSEQYGLRLTIQDLAEVAASINARRGEQIARTSCAYSSTVPQGAVAVTEHWKVFYSANPTDASVISKLFQSDLIGFQNIWDLIPYSFVVDWFSPVGDILQGWDDELMLSHLPIHAIVIGQKATYSTQWVEDGINYSFSASCYTRSKSKSFPPYAFTTRRSVSTNIVVNGAALIVQRL